MRRRGILGVVLVAGSGLVAASFAWWHLTDGGDATNNLPTGIYGRAEGYFEHATVTNSDRSVERAEPSTASSRNPDTTLLSFLERFEHLRVSYEKEDLRLAFRLRSDLANSALPETDDFWLVFAAYVASQPRRSASHSLFLDELLVSVGSRLYGAIASQGASPESTLIELERSLEQLLAQGPLSEAAQWYSNNPASGIQTVVPLESDPDSWAAFSLLTGVLTLIGGVDSPTLEHPIAALLSTDPDGVDGRLYRPQIEACGYLALVNARRHVEDIRRLGSRTPSAEVRRACLNALVALGDADSMVALELSLAELAEQQRWKDLRTTIEDAVINHPRLTAILPAVGEAIADAPGLTFQQLATALTKGLVTRRKKVGRNGQQDRDALLEFALATRDPKLWYDLGSNLARAFYPTPPELLLKHMEDLLLYGFDAVGNTDAESMAYTHVLSALLVLTDDVRRTLTVIDKLDLTSSTTRSGVEFFLEGIMRRKFLSGKITPADFEAAYDFLPPYCLGSLRRLEDATTYNLANSDSRANVTYLLRGLWLMLQPKDPDKVRGLVTSLAEATSGWQSSFFVDVLVDYDEFRTRYMDGDVVKPDWPAYVPKEEWVK